MRVVVFGADGIALCSYQRGAECSCPGVEQRLPVVEVLAEAILMLCPAPEYGGTGGLDGGSGLAGAPKPLVYGNLKLVE